MILNGGLISQALMGGGSGGGTIAVPDIINYFIGKTPEAELLLIPGYTAKMWVAPDGMFFTYWDTPDIQWNSDYTKAHAYISQKQKRSTIVVGVFCGDTLIHMTPCFRRVPLNESYLSVEDEKSENGYKVYCYNRTEMIYSNFMMTWIQLNTSAVTVNLTSDRNNHYVEYNEDGSIKRESTTEQKNITIGSLNIYPYYIYTQDYRDKIIGFGNLSEKEQEKATLDFAQALIDNAGYKPTA